MIEDELIKQVVTDPRVMPPVGYRLFQVVAVFSSPEATWEDRAQCLLFLQEFAEKVLTELEKGDSNEGQGAVREGVSENLG